MSPPAPRKGQIIFSNRLNSHHTVRAPVGSTRLKIRFDDGVRIGRVSGRLAHDLVAGISGISLSHTHTLVYLSQHTHTHTLVSLSLSLSHTLVSLSHTHCSWQGDGRRAVAKWRVREDGGGKRQRGFHPVQIAHLLADSSQVDILPRTSLKLTSLCFRCRLFNKFSKVDVLGGRVKGGREMACPRRWWRRTSPWRFPSSSPPSHPLKHTHAHIHTHTHTHTLVALSLSLSHTHTPVSLSCTHTHLPRPLPHTRTNCSWQGEGRRAVAKWRVREDGRGGRLRGSPPQPLPP